MTDCYTCTSSIICTKCKNNKYLDSASKGCFANCLSDTNSNYLNIYIANKNNIFFPYTEPSVSAKNNITNDLKCLKCIDGSPNMADCTICSSDSVCI